MFTDGPLYAFELQHTLANARVSRGSSTAARVKARETAAPPRAYHDGVFGMASAALSQGVAAYVGPLWKISRYRCQEHGRGILRGAADAPHESWRSAGARAPQREGANPISTSWSRASGANPHHDLEREVPRSAGWAGMVLYGDPTPTVLQRISPSRTRVIGRRKNNAAWGIFVALSTTRRRGFSRS